MTRAGSVRAGLEAEEGRGEARGGVARSGYELLHTSWPARARVGRDGGLPSGLEGSCSRGGENNVKGKAVLGS